MSKQGPKLLSTKDGYAFAKFNGRKINFGRSDDPQARIRFAAMKLRWEENGRELADDMLPDRMQPGVVTVTGVCDQFLAHVREINAAEWQHNNYARVELALRPVRDLYGPLPAAGFGPILSGGRSSRPLGGGCAPARGAAAVFRLMEPSEVGAGDLRPCGERSTPLFHFPVARGRL